MSSFWSSHWGFKIIEAPQTVKTLRDIPFTFALIRLVRLSLFEVIGPSAQMYKWRLYLFSSVLGSGGGGGAV
jgi:hypothetical protein